MNTPELAQWLTVLRVVPRLWAQDAWTQSDIQLVSEHFQYLQELCRQGKVLIVGRTDVEMKDNLGLVIFLAETEEAARSLMNNDPVVRNAVMTAELFPYRLALLSEALNTMKHT